MLSLEQGVELKGDPYSLKPDAVPGATEAMQRSLVKQLALTAINAPDKKSAFGAFRDGWPKNHPGKTMDNAQLEGLLNAFISRHPHLRSSICTDQGIRLMYIDSCIAEKVIRTFTVAEIPILCIHDSFIVDYSYSLALIKQMKSASLLHVGKELPVEIGAVGLDSMRANGTPEHVINDFIAYRQAERTEGYHQR